MNPILTAVSFVSLVLIAALGTRAVRGYALRRLLDLPNDRSSHRVPTPRGGGLAIVAAFALAVLVLYGSGHLAFPLLMALAGALPVAAVGFWDDHGHVPVRLRLLIQIAATAWSLYWLGGFGSVAFGGETVHLGWLGTLLGGWFLVWMLNLFNFMDGIDGLAGGEAVTAAGSAALLLALGAATDGTAGAALALAAASGGFLVWNWPPARIFMGDVGSGFLGFLLAVLALYTAKAGSLSLAVWLILVGVFFVDATLTLLRRILSGQRWYEAHRSHAYQHAARYWASHERVTRAVLLINLVWLLPLALAARQWPALELLWLGMAYAPLVGLAFRFKAGTT
jgi:Fuc2NAc and GlcNAc transferase